MFLPALESESRSTDEADMDVLIVGAGPSGLLMALECVQRGLSCRIIDKEMARNLNSKAIAIQPGTLQILEEMGIVEPFLKKGCKIECITPMAQKEILAFFDFSQLDTKYPFILSLEQSETESLLEQRLSSHSLCVERGCELVSFHQTKQEVIATVRDKKSGKEEQIKASFLLGCDGAHSCVRKQLGFKFSGEKIPRTFALADVQISWQYPHNRALLFLDPQGLLAVFPLPGEKRYRVVVPSEKKLSCQGIESLLRSKSCIEVKITDLQWQSSFQVHSRIVDRYGEGRVFLLGDAAHVHSPIGGQGMNTGLQDVHNLAPKLAQVIQGKIDISWLENYTKERRAVGRSLLDATKRATKMAALQSPFLCLLRNCGFRILMKSPQLKKHLMMAIAQLAK